MNGRLQPGDVVTVTDDTGVLSLLNLTVVDVIGDIALCAYRGDGDAGHGRWFDTTRWRLDLVTPRPEPPPPPPRRAQLLRFRGWRTPTRAALPTSSPPQP